MSAAWLLTVLAWVGVVAGVLLLEPHRRISGGFAAAGGGVLFGIALFWLIPEMTEEAGKLAALYAVGGCGLIAGVDRLLAHTGHSPRHGVVAPVLAATAIHSFLDGWSVRALRLLPLVPVGLAMHKVPEGLALGWVTRLATQRRGVAIFICALVEAVTLVGAAIEPIANRSATAAFGANWSIAILAVIAGTFLFFGLHAVLPEWRRASVWTIFSLTLVAMWLVARFSAF